MRSRLRLFAVVGLIATALDVGLLLALQDLGLLLANLIALVVAAAVSYLLNRLLTFRGRRNARWVQTPSVFAAMAVVAGLVDMAVLLALDSSGLDLVAAKLLAVVSGAVVRWTGYRWVLFNTVRREMSERLVRVPAPGRLRLSVVVPAFNEADGIAGTLRALNERITTTVDPAELEIIVVDDGSSDRTAEEAAAAGARVVRQSSNRGKGAAVRTGFIEANGRSVIFTDADLAYPPQTVLDVLDELEQGWDFVVGSRRHQDTTTLVRARRLRELGGLAVNWLTHLVLLGHFRDTQCGIKGFRGDLGRVVFERTVIDGFAFDVELFLIAEQDQLSVKEVAVLVENRGASSVRLVTDTVQLLRDLLRIRRRAGAGGYRPTHHQDLILRGSLTDGTTGQDV
jgi:putative flippase GtrA